MEISKREPIEKVSSLRGMRLGLLCISSFFAIIAIGCSDPENTSTNTKVANSQISQSNGQSTKPAVINANEVNDPNAANTNTLTRGDEMMRRIEKIRSEAANKPVDPNAGKIVRNGAEDSVITTQLADQAREIRVFNKHPVLLSVEKVHDGNEGAVYVTLRDGRKITLNGNAVMNIETFTSVQILQLAGIANGSAPATTRPADSTKKSSN